MHSPSPKHIPQRAQKGRREFLTHLAPFQMFVLFSADCYDGRCFRGVLAIFIVEARRDDQLLIGRLQVQGVDLCNVTDRVDNGGILCGVLACRQRGRHIFNLFGADRRLVELIWEVERVGQTQICVFFLPRVRHAQREIGGGDVQILREGRRHKIHDTVFYRQSGFGSEHEIELAFREITRCQRDRISNPRYLALSNCEDTELLISYGIISHCICDCVVYCVRPRVWL